LTAIASDRSIPVEPPVGAEAAETGAPAPYRVGGIAASLGSIPIEDLEFRARSVTRDQVRVWFDGFPETEEVAVLTTCHRVELVLLVRSRAEVSRWLEVLPGPARSWRVRTGGDLVHHLFRVAAGRESLASGEVEVRHQVRTAQRSIESRHPRPVLAGLFSAAVAAAEDIAPEGARLPSIARVASDALRERVSGPSPRVLVVGTGAVGRQVAEQLTGWAKVTMAYRARPPSPQFVASTGVRAVGLGSIPAELPRADAVVTAIKSGVPCLEISDLPRDRPLVLVDLGMPRNIDPRARTLSNVHLIDLEELHARPGPGGPPSDADARIEALSEAYDAVMQRQLRETWVDAWLGSAEEIRQEELANARQYWGPLTPEQEAAIRRLTQRLVGRLLVPSAERLRSLPAGPDGDRDRQLAWRLLRLDARGP